MSDLFHLANVYSSIIFLICSCHPINSIVCVCFWQSDRLKQVMEHLSTLHSLCEVLGIDFKQTLYEVHPSLGEADGSKNLSNSTIERLASAVNALREMKVQRMQKVSNLSMTLEIWAIQSTQLLTLLISISEYDSFKIWHLACLCFGTSWKHHLKSSRCSMM